ncbi:MAG TPA: amino acid ABC transporter substrate-binding protein, partial [Rhodospirillaceae bacterium]|nr:amino acid ABC transporter substrate-binding protein [Rhodospirillaceae bacterium]
MSMRKVILSSATLAIALWLAPGAGAADPIKIGIVGPNTGPAATTGLTVTATWKLVADEYNGKGG